MSSFVLLKCQMNTMLYYTGLRAIVIDIFGSYINQIVVCILTFLVLVHNKLTVYLILKCLSFSVITVCDTESCHSTTLYTW